MVQFIDVDPAELQGHREGRRGRVSYPILKSFLETGKPAAQLDRTGMQQSLMSLTSCLTSYIKSHELPIKLLQRRGQLFLVRLDIDADGNPIEGWQKVSHTTDGHKGHLEDVPATPLDANEVSRRFTLEHNQVTK